MNRERNKIRWHFWPIWATVSAAGLLGWLILLGTGDPGAWRGLLVNFVYFTPLAAGMAAWPAVVVISNGRWSVPIERIALAGMGFAPLSILAFIVLWIGAPHWANWMGMRLHPQSVWLNAPALFIRDFIALCVLWALGAWFVLRSIRGEPRAKIAAVFVFAYCAVFTLLAFDLVMGLKPRWFSTLFGGYFFMSGMYTAVAAWTLGTVVFSPRSAWERFHDLGKLIVAFSLMTTYMMFSQLLPIWYENLPHEVLYAVPRLQTQDWRWVSLLLLATVYLGPLVFLLPRESKRTVPYMGLASLTILVFMWLERWWLVVPSLGGNPGPGAAEICITVAFAAAMIAASDLFLRFFPEKAPEGSARP